MLQGCLRLSIMISFVGRVFVCKTSEGFSILVQAVTIKNSANIDLFIDIILNFSECKIQKTRSKPFKKHDL